MPARAEPAPARQEPAAPAPAAAVPEAAALVASSSGPSAAQAEASQMPGAAPPACNPSRCTECRKKVGLTGFKCKCGFVFCGQHRYAEAHNCAFDYKSTERAKLAENNPVVQAAKIQKI